MNWGKRPNQGRGTANKHEQGRGKRPHFRLGTIQITMISIIHIPTGRDGMMRGGSKSSGKDSRRNTAIRFLT